MANKRTSSSSKYKKKQQTWRYSFDLVNVTLTKELTIKLGKSKLYIKPVTKTKCTGYYQNSFFDVGLNEHRGKEQVKIDFEYFSKILYLNNFSSLKLKWKNIHTITKTKWPVKIVHESFTMPIKFKFLKQRKTKEDFEVLQKTFSDIEKNPFKSQIKLCLEWLYKDTKTILEEFLCNWISFNILYNIVSPTAKEKDSIIKLGNTHPQYRKLNKLLKDEQHLIEKLIQKNIIAEWNGNLSNKLKFSNKNKKKSRETWVNLLLCLYVIRSQLFHEGKYDQDLLKIINWLFRTIIPLIILEII